LIDLFIYLLEATLCPNGGHNHNQDGGHQDAFQSWVLIEKSPYRGSLQVWFSNFQQMEIFFDLSAKLISAILATKFV